MFKSKVWDDVYEKKKFLHHFNQLGGSKGGLVIMFPNLPHPHMRMKMMVENATKKWSAYASQCGKLYKQSTFLGN